MSNRGRFLLALAAGVPLALLGVEFGLIVMGIMLLGALMAGIYAGRLAFGGMTIGLGATWFVLFVLGAQQCAQPDQPCGATPVDLTPFIIISAALVVIGAIAALSGLRASRGSDDLS